MKDVALEPGGDQEIDSRMFDEKKKQEKEKIKKQIEEQITAYRRGFHLYGKYVYDCARVFASLPRQNVIPPALAIRGGVSIWTTPGGPNPLVPGMALLNSYDYLLDVNKLPQFDLSQYKLIVVHDPPTVSDATIETITKWLKEQPVLLCVHKNLTDDNTAEASTPEDHDGKLKNDWPWEKDLKVVVGAPAKRAKLARLDLAGRPATWP